MQFVLRVVVAAVAVWLADLLLPGMSVTQVPQTWQQVLVYGVVGLVLTLVQSLIKPLVVALTFVFYIVTLGLFGIVVNALMLLLVSWLTGFFEWGLQVDDFWPTALLGGIVIAIVTTILMAVLPKPEDRRRQRRR